MNSKVIGNIAESQVIAALIKKGKKVLLPFGDNERYDLVIEENGKFKRVQTKSGKLKNGVISFATKSTNRINGKSVGKNYTGQIEFFAIYCLETNKVYLISIDETREGSCYLRVNCPKNNQKKHIKYAKKYEI